MSQKVYLQCSDKAIEKLKADDILKFDSIILTILGDNYVVYC